MFKHIIYYIFYKQRYNNSLPYFYDANTALHTLKTAFMLILYLLYKNDNITNGFNEKLMKILGIVSKVRINKSML